LHIAANIQLMQIKGYLSGQVLQEFAGIVTEMAARFGVKHDRMPMGWLRHCWWLDLHSVILAAWSWPLLVPKNQCSGASLCICSPV
jgi:hypothetical protein